MISLIHVDSIQKYLLINGQENVLHDIIALYHYSDIIISASNHWRLDGFLNYLLGHRSKKTSKLGVTGLCEGNSQVTGEFPSQRTSNAEKFSIDDIIMMNIILVQDKMIDMIYMI